MQLTETQKQVLVIGVIVGFVAIFAVIYVQFMVFSDRKTESQEWIERAQGEIRTVRDELRTMQRFMENESERAELEARVDSARRRLPSDPQAQQFLEILRDTLVNTGVSFSYLSPESTVRRSMYDEIPYSIRGNARYHEFGQFINIIECHPERFMRVTGFTLRNDARRPSVHPMEVGISTFMFRGS